MHPNAYEKLLHNKVEKVFYDSIRIFENIRRLGKNDYADTFCHVVASHYPEIPAFKDGMIFGGSKGCGRHIAASKALNVYIETNSIVDDSMCFLYLSSDMFNFSKEEVAADLEFRSNINMEDADCGMNIAETLIDEILDYALGNIEKRVEDSIDNIDEKYMILFIDDSLKSDYSNQFLKRVAYHLNYYNHALTENGYGDNEDRPKMVIFLVTDNINEIPQDLLVNLHLLYFNKPNLEERKRIFEKTNIKKRFIDIAAKESENMTCREIKSIGDNISMVDDITEGEIIEYIRSISIMTRSEGTSMDVSALMAGIGTVMNNSSSSVNIEKNNAKNETKVNIQPKTAKDIADESDNMTFNEFSEDLFGKPWDFSILDK